MEREMDIFSGERNLPKMDIEVNKVAPEGLGFGEGSISLEARRNELSDETLSNIESAVGTADILVPVSTDKDGKMIDDDGCGDGRSVGRIFEGSEERNKSLDRPKVFGGGVMMAAAARIGLGEAAGRPVRQTVSDSISMLRDKMIGFGAHTDTHAHGEKCGCGAIDNAPAIIGSAVKFKDQIRASIEALGIDTTGLDEVEASYAQYASSELGDYAGTDVMNEIINNGKIVKELDDNHKEVIVILNTVENHTVDQEKVREVSGNQAQAFAVDVWRVKQLADRLYDGASDEVKHKAFLSELVYTLSTAGVLTKGDLPVYVISKQPEAIAV
jgi:hypothetical protein